MCVCESTNLKLTNFQFAMSATKQQQQIAINSKQLNRKKSTVILLSVNCRVHRRALVTFTSAKTFPLSIW